MSRPAGAPNLRDTEIAAIIAAVKKRLHRVREKEIGMMRCYELAGEEVGFDAKTVGRVWRMLQPTTGLATDYIRARAFRMARKVVTEASVPDLIDILSRPNVGVLEPIKKQEAGGGGFFISVSADSCGAVNVGIQGAPAQPQLPAPMEIDGDTIEMEAEEVEEAPKPIKSRGFGVSDRYKQALEQAKARLEKRRKKNEQQQRYRAKKKLDNTQNAE